MREPLIRRATPADAAGLSALHAEMFERGWHTGFWAGQIAEPAGSIFVAEGPQVGLIGYILARRLIDEAEILSIGIAAAYRRRGIAVALLNELTSALGHDLPCRLFLEVSTENEAAIAFYRRMGFAQVGYRKHYYSVPGRAPVDAMIWAQDIATSTL